MRNKSKKIAVIGILTGVSLVLSYLEAILPPIYAVVPGIKVGLANIVIVFTLYKFGPKDAAVISFIRVFAVALLFGNIMTLCYSIAGAVLSLIVMILIKRFNLFSPVGVSIIGGIFHNLGQILVAILLLNSTLIGYYMIILTITGTLAGVAVGLIGALLIKRFEKISI